MMHATKIQGYAKQAAKSQTLGDKSTALIGL